MHILNYNIENINYIIIRSLRKLLSTQFRALLHVFKYNLYNI